VPPLGKEELTGLFNANEKWHVTQAAEQHARRSVYLLCRRTFTYPMFAAFDPPEVMTSCAGRLQTIVPTQALTLLNSPVAQQQSVEFARRLLRDGADTPAQAVDRAWRLAFGRPVTAAEAKHATAFLARRMSAAGSLSPAARETAWAELCLALFNANEFAYVD
jgi:hypothetical protein